MHFLFFLLFPAILTASLNDTPVLWKGRYRPMEAMARDWMEEISGSSNGSSLDTLLEIYTHGHEPYDDQALIKVDDPTALGLDPKTPLFSYNQIQHGPQGADLKLARRLTLYTKPQILAVPDLLNEGKWKEMRQVNPETLPSLFAPLAGKPYQLAPGVIQYYPTLWQLKLEVWYTKVAWVPILIGLYGLALVLYRFRWAVIIPLILHTALLAARVAILGRPPVSNMAETVLYVPWIAAMTTLFINQRFLRISAYITIIALLILLQISSFGHQLEPVQAVLDSKFWLLIHVLMVVGSYPFFLIAGVMAHIAMVSRRSLSSPIRTCLYIGIALLIPGTILGGVWAAQSWGRFWDWDPKESWAFISSALFLVVVHLDRFKKIGSFGLSFGTIIGFQAITFTWYGVNYILGTGLHSYGFGNGEKGYLAFVAADTLFLLVMLIKKWLTNKPKMVY